MENRVLDGVMGLCVADALGVPVEFMTRETLISDPVTGMRAYGTYHQPAGTWSDDTSMTLCFVHSLSKKLDYEDIMMEFMKWFREAKYTPHGEVFDIGIATQEALIRFEEGTEPLQCGGTTEYDNGNGSLMRILPSLFYLQAKYGPQFYEKDEAFTIIHNISALTHAHKRSQIACGIYISIAAHVAGRGNLQQAVKSGLANAIKFYEQHDDFQRRTCSLHALAGRGFC